MLTTSG